MEHDVSNQEEKGKESNCNAENEKEEKAMNTVADNETLQDDSKGNGRCKKDPSNTKSGDDMEGFFSSGGLAPKIIVFSLFVCLVIYSKYSTISILIRNSQQGHNFNHPDEYVTKFHELWRSFPNQHKEYLSVLKNSGQRHITKVITKEIRKNTQGSQIYLLAGYGNSKETVNCFVNKLVDAFTTEELDDSRVIDGSTFKGRDLAALIDVMDLLLAGSRKLLVLKDVDKFSFNLENLLMSFHYAYPHSILLLTAELPFSYNHVRSHHDDEALAGQHFKDQVWWDHLILIRNEENNPCLKGSKIQEL